MCVRLFLWRHQCAPLASDGTRAFYWGLHPESMKCVGFIYVHVVTYERWSRLCTCVYVCMRAVYGICARPRVQFSVLCHSVYRGQWSWRVHRACRRFSDFRMYAWPLRTMKIRRTGYISRSFIRPMQIYFNMFNRKDQFLPVFFRKIPVFTDCI